MDSTLVVEGLHLTFPVVPAEVDRLFLLERVDATGADH
jgi:hypothetical protein